MQYQKLIDSRPIDLSTSANSIDPALGYNFLVNGVVHCLPFLSKIWHNKGKDLSSVADEDLRSAGILKAADRSNILLSIREFIDNDRPVIPSAPTKHSQSVSDDDEQSKTTKIETGELLAECVICMENSVSFFNFNSHVMSAGMSVFLLTLFLFKVRFGNETVVYVISQICRTFIRTLIGFSVQFD